MTETTERRTVQDDWVLVPREPAIAKAQRLASEADAAAMEVLGDPRIGVSLPPTGDGGGK